jgi:hypothetical protein
LRLYRYDDHVRAAQRFGIRIELNAPACQRRDVRLRLRLDYRELARIEPKPQPAFEQGAAHFAGADQNEQAGEIAQV